jgi:photosystem II stability/assembly factor-like uncharacterized protein
MSARLGRLGAIGLVLGLCWTTPRVPGQEGAAGESSNAGTFAGLTYRSIGPAAGGRICRVAGVAGNPLIYFAATASGGVWRSQDGGLTWKCTTDREPFSSAGSIAVAPSDPNVVYVGAGEANIRNNVVPGNGIYKSTDGGSTWAHVWKQDGQIGTMIVHPRNPDIAFAAVLGKFSGPNGERGVYRTTDGGKSWTAVLKKDADTGASDVGFDPSNPNIVFAGLWQARRRPWELTSGGPGGGLHVSRDGGATWKPITGHGLPPGPWGKVGVAVAPSDGRRVYAIVEADKGGLFRSDDGGRTWSLASGDRTLRQRAWYYSTIVVDPHNPDVLWCPNVPMLKSIDGGKTFRRAAGFHHGDHHDIWIDPADTRRMIAGHDGGVEISTSGGATWYRPPLPIGQFYRINVDTRKPYHVSGTMQDLGSISGPSNSLAYNGVALSDWHDVGGGEAGYTASDPAEPDVVYAGEYSGVITRYDHRTRQARMVGADIENASGHGAVDMKYRFRWPAPIALSPHDSRVIYHAANVLFRSADAGQTWSIVSPDLTRNDPRRQQWSGGPITGDNTTAEYYCTISAVAESPKQKGVIWVGSDDGLVQVSTDAGKSWKNVTDKLTGLPEWGTIKMIEPSTYDAATAYVIVDAHLVDDMHPYLYKTADTGQTWRRLDGPLPRDIPLHVVREDPEKRGALYVGNERGVVYSPDDGHSWMPIQLNLPTVPVHDLRVKDGDLLLGTHGRSVWILDDLTPIRHWNPATADASGLLPPRPATRWRYHRAVGGEGMAPNPPTGAVFTYRLKTKPKDRPRIEILDGDGKLIRTLGRDPEPEPDIPGGDPAASGEEEASGEEPRAAEEREEEEDEDRPAGRRGAQRLPDRPGLHRVAWDLQHDPARPIKGASIDAGSPETGPLALPGRYTVKLIVDDRTFTAPLEITPDPRVRIAAAELADQVRLALAVRDDFNRLSDAVERLRSVRKQIADRNALLKGNAAAQPLVKAATELATTLDAVEGKLHNPKARITYDILAQRGGAQLYSQLGWLYSMVLEGDGPPTQGMREASSRLHEELTRQLDSLRGLLEKDLADLNRQARSLELPHLIVPTPRKKPGDAPSK